MASSGSTVQYWSSWPQDTPQAKIFKEAAVAFTKATGVKVDIRNLGGTATQDVINAFATGSGPDMFDNAPDRVAQYAARGIIADLNPVLDTVGDGESSMVRDLYPAAVLENASTNGSVNFVPHTVLSAGIWFDASTNPEFKDNAPKTWQEFLAAVAKLKSESKVPIAQEGTTSAYNVLWFLWLMLRSAGPGSVAGLSKSEDAWNAPSVLESAKQVAALHDGGFFQDGFEGSRYPNAQNAWAKGDYVLDLNGSWLAGEVKDIAPNPATLSTFPFPEFGASSQPVVELNTLGWSISSKASNPAGAAQLITFLTGRSWADKIGTDALNIPARKDATAPEPLIAMQKSVTDATVTTGYMDNAVVEAPTWFKDVFLPLNDQLIFGKLTPEEFIKQGKSQTATYIATGTK